MQTSFSVSDRWLGAFDETSLVAWAESLYQRLGGKPVSLGLVFVSPDLFPYAEQVLEILRVHARIPLLLGCSSGALIEGSEEITGGVGLVLGLYSFPKSDLKAFRLSAAEVASEYADPSSWRERFGGGKHASQGWLVFADPFQTDVEGWLNRWNQSFSPEVVLGGLASSGPSMLRCQLYLDGQVFEDGCVVLSVGGGVRLEGLISQGCTPIGETWTLTKVERNLIREIGNRPAYEVLVETFQNLSDEERRKTQGNLCVGLVINEYAEDFHRGDFLIRNVLGVDAQAGVVAVGALPRLGQTLQFQRRDAAAAREDLDVLLESLRERLKENRVLGGCLCCCNGRGERFFSEPDHDSRKVQETLGPMGLVGFFCNGEIGPVGRVNFIHGYTASLALFVEDREASDLPNE